MAVYICERCGAQLEVTEGAATAVCQYCGTRQTVAAVREDEGKQAARVLVQRAFIFLEDGDFARAADYCEQALDRDPTCAKAYLGKLLAGLHLRRAEELAGIENVPEGNADYQKLLRFADGQLRGQILGCMQQVQRKAEERQRLQREAEEARRIAEEKQDAKEARILKIGLLCAGIAGAALLLLFLLIIPAFQYIRGHTAMAAGDYAAAADGFQKALYLPGADRLEKQTRRIAGRQQLPVSPKVGDTFTYGSYEQDNAEENGPEPIEWQVLAMEGDKMLVISRYCLDAHDYDYDYGHYTDEGAPVYWEQSDLHRWLSGTLRQDMFSPAEESRILPAEGGVEGDTLFLLSQAEVELYMPTEASRETSATQYAQARASHGISGWWLRTPGSQLSNALAVRMYNAAIDDCPVILDMGIRPAMWIDLGE